MLKTSPSTGHCKAFSLKPVKYKQSNPRQKTFPHHPSTYSDFHHKLRAIIRGIDERDLTLVLKLIQELWGCDTEQALTHLAAIQGGVR
jgi:hypothetical protein